MSDHNLAEALRALLSEPDRTPEQRPDRWRAALKALAAHEAEQQAGEAVIYSISAQNHTEDAYATVQILNSAGKGYLELPMKAGTKLFTHPQRPLSEAEAASIFKAWREGPLWLHMTRGVEAAHGIGITKDTK